jgi:hypothetical protein
MLRLLNILLFTATPSANTGLRYAQFVTAAGLAFSHGANDAQKSMGMLTLALLLGGFIPTFEVPFWVMLACAIAITLGILSGGWRIVRTLGFAIYRVRPIHALSSQLTSAAVILTASVIGAPVSTTHVVAHLDHGHRFLGAAESRALEKGQGHCHHLGHHHPRFGTGCHSDIRSRQSLSRKGLISCRTQALHHPPSLAESCIGSFRKYRISSPCWPNKARRWALAPVCWSSTWAPAPPEVAKRVSRPNTRGSPQGSQSDAAQRSVLDADRPRGPAPGDHQPR